MNISEPNVSQQISNPQYMKEIEKNGEIIIQL